MSVAEREQVLGAFLEQEQERLARACHEMARAYASGGTLVPFGTGAAATDAAHVAVEFMHPVIVGKRALPALAPTNDPTDASTPALLLQPDDIALALAHGEPSVAVDDFLATARERARLTLAFTGAGARAAADFAFAVPSDDPDIVQEVQETAYHVLWELVHVFFEHPALLEDACITCGDVAVEAEVVALHNGSAVIERDGAREEVAVELLDEVSVGDRVLCHAGVALERIGTGEPAQAADAGEAAFLYPFLGSGEGDLDAVLADVRASTLQKGRDVVELRRAIDVGAVGRCAADVRARLERGGRLVAFGNGGSSTDAQDAAADCLARGWPAICLTNDVATVTAVGNDVGFENVFARQLIPLAREADVALAISTSGSSPNVVSGLEEAHRRHMLTVAITGYDGGRLAELDWLDHLFVVRSDYVPRLQEAHATIYHLLLDEVGAR
ncbi:MAG TPA: SIS domain-containing protein [Thermoleophilaceae bacterium]|nr:SIS domain-containing protein [Thermoleophilaceae bacterium]